MAETLDTWEHVAQDGSHTWSETPVQWSPVGEEDSILHKAAYSGDVGQLAMALVGVDHIDNRSSANYCTPLHLAIRGNQPEAVRMLLMAGADPQIRDELEPCYGVQYPAVEAAAWLGCNGALVALIEFGVPVPGGALSVAASLNRVDCLQTLLPRLQCEVSPKSLLLDDVRSALNAAALCWHTRAVGFLLTKVPGFPDATLEIDRTALTNAMHSLLITYYCIDRCRENSLGFDDSTKPILERLVNAGACVDSRAFWRCFHRLPIPLDAVRFLLKCGLQVPTTYKGDDDDMFAPHSAGLSLIFHVVRDADSDTSILDAFLTAGASATVTDTSLNTPLHCVTHRSFAEILIKHGADVHAKNTKGQTPLYTAWMSKHFEVAQLLMLRGAEVSEVTQDRHWISLMSTATNTYPFWNADWDPPSRLQMTEFFLDHGANINALNDDGSTALHMAAICHDTALMRHLITRGADVFATDYALQSVLHAACNAHNWSGSYESELTQTIHLLIDNGADPNAKNNSGATPLHCLLRGLTCWNSSPEPVNALLERGADMGGKDNEGNTPREMLDMSKWTFDDKALLQKVPPKPYVPETIILEPYVRGRADERGRGRGQGGRGRGGYRSTWT